jgi:PAS domain S-box-containing protein
MAKDPASSSPSSSGRREGEPPRKVSDGELLRVTLSSIGDGVISTDPHGRVTFLNPVAQALTGWTLAQAVGHSLEVVFKIVNEDTRATVENPVVRALKEGVIVGLANHTLLIAKDGTERLIDDSAAPIRSDKGEVAGAVLVFRDVTERRDQEHAVQHALEYAQGIVSTIRESLLVLHSDLRVKSANRTFYKLFRVSPEDVEGRFIFQIGNGQWDIPKLRELLEGVLPQDRTFDEFEVELELDGVGPKLMVLNARRVQEGEELILLAIEDATERREAQRRLRDSETRYRKLFEAAQDGILLLDVGNGKITDANPYVARLIGIPSQNLIGKELWEIGLFEDIEENKQAFERLRRDGYVQYDHLPLRNVNGETMPVEFVSNLYQEDGKLVAQCNVRSIAERRLRDLNRALADESRRKDEFLAMLSHELRNPLAPIRSAVHLLRVLERPGEDPVQKQAHDIIERQVANLTKLISDLLEVSRVLSGRLHMDLQLVDLNETLRHAIETVQPMLDQRKHRLELHACPQNLWTNADATRIEEVFVNILTNAAKYTPADGQGRIDVWCEAAGGGARGTPQARVRIRDNGVGIDEELLPRIFDLFTQADRSLDRSTGGLGIGLSLAQRLVQLHGGSIEAQSPPPDQGTGSVITIQLPLAEPPLQWDRDPALRSPTKDDRRDWSGSAPVRVLVVDDNRDQVMMMAGCLRLDGYSVEAAYDGLEGLKAAQRWRPDIVLLDIGLPGLDGYEVARRLRADSETKDIRLIALTGYGRESDIEHARQAGFDGHLTKPVEFKDLRQMLISPKI